jgi:response regulator RpfG family c-di-GMP phosphodiesterase
LKRVPTNVRLAERLAAEGQISQQQCDAAATFAQHNGERIEEALLETGALDEAALLKYLAAHYQTRFVSTEKLGNAKIDRFTLSKIPQKLAEMHGVFPVLWEPKTSVISIVTADPDDAPAVQDVQMASEAKDVRVFVGRPKAVRAAIAKNYAGDMRAFALLERAGAPDMLDVFDRSLMETGGFVLERQGTEPTPQPAATVTATAAAKRPLPDVLGEPFRETLNVLVTLVESTRAELRGHSAQVARLMRQAAERVGLSERDKAAAIVAGYLHDLGKMGAYHLTALNVAEYEAHRTAARKLDTAPLRMMESVGLPVEVARAIEHMYERHDGTGFPEEQSGKEIPIIARLLAITDTYADLTQNPRNPYRRVLEPVQACQVLARYRGGVFDPNLVDVFRMMVTGDDLKARLLATRHRVLLLDPDPEETTVLELRMMEQGFQVHAARDPEEAKTLLESGVVELVVSEMELEPEDGIAFLKRARQAEWGKALPWVFLTGRAGGGDAQRAFAAGAADYVTKPCSADLLVTKLKQILEREAGVGGGRGVSGSLTEMSLPDMVQVLFHGKKSGALKIRSTGRSGEIHFVAGDIYNALWEEVRGAEAFYAMLTLKEGDFVLDPNSVADQRVIDDSPDGLLLEGMRRLDEGL